jgi:chromosome segregation ATPase
VAGLTGIFKAIDAPPPEQETDKLKDLFRNRAELKKEFAALRNEKYQLEDRVKEHRASIERVEQKLNHLESLLLDPEWVHNVVTFYQLRRLAAHCESRLARFAEQLKRQRERRIEDRVMAAFQEAQEEKRAEVDARIGEHRMRLQLLEDQLQAERHKLQTMGGLSKMMKGKAQEESIDEIESALAEAQAGEAELLQELDQVEQTSPPPHEGLLLSDKRSINFMILSYAQQMYLDYFEDNLARLAKETGDKSVGSVNYGGKADCDEILECLWQRKDEVEQKENSTGLLQKRAKLISQHAMFRHDDDAVPEPGSVATVIDVNMNGVVSKIDANLLGENYFGVAKVLSR